MSRNLSNDERIWWTVLADAEMYIQMHNGDGDGEGALMAHEVSCEARKMLVTRFGVNLDTISPKARDVYLRLLEERRAKKRAEDRRMEEIYALLRRSDELILFSEVMNA